VVHKCCGSPAGAPGCVVGAHVFKDPDDFELLHARHPYSKSSDFGDNTPRSSTPQSPGVSSQQKSGTPPQSTLLDVAALDCEMIYTTAGMSIARVSVIDGSGKPVYDKLIKLDPGVEVL
jgi:RNA exonuclease 1